MTGMQPKGDEPRLITDPSRVGQRRVTDLQNDWCFVNLSHHRTGGNNIKAGALPQMCRLIPGAARVFHIATTATWFTECIATEATLPSVMS